MRDPVFMDELRATLDKLEADPAYVPVNEVDQLVQLALHGYNRLWVEDKKYFIKAIRTLMADIEELEAELGKFKECDGSDVLKGELSGACERAVYHKEGE